MERITINRHLKKSLKADGLTREQYKCVLKDAEDWNAICFHVEGQERREALFQSGKKSEGNYRKWIKWYQNGIDFAVGRMEERREDRPIACQQYPGYERYQQWRKAKGAAADVAANVEKVAKVDVKDWHEMLTHSEALRENTDAKQIAHHTTQRDAAIDRLQKRNAARTAEEKALIEPLAEKGLAAALTKDYGEPVSEEYAVRLASLVLESATQERQQKAAVDNLKAAAQMLK